jgi:glyoxylase-like metal-dependent hydrolase (beta-lactamase superfamily II)
LVVLTHGHTDDTGAANPVSRAGAPIAIGANDGGLLEHGANGQLSATGLAGCTLRPPVSRMAFDAASLQIVVREPQRLDLSESPLLSCRSPVTPPAPASCCSTTAGPKVDVGSRTACHLAFP